MLADKKQKTISCRTDTNSLINRCNMSRMIFFLFVLVLAYASSNAGELDILPNKVSKGDQVELVYSTQNEISSVKAVFYLFNDFDPMPRAEEIQLNKVSDLYKASYKIPYDVVFTLIKVIYTQSDKTGFTNIIWKTDDNKGRFWDLLIQQNGKPIQGANVRAGLSYMGNMPSNFRRIPNLNSAEVYFKQEDNFYPKQQLAKIALSSLKLDTRKINKEGYDEELRYILNKRFNTNNESELRAVTRALKSINETDKAENLELMFAKKNPQSDLSAELLIAKISEAKDLEEFIKYSDFYLKQFPNHSSRERILNAYSKAYLQSKPVDSLMKKLSRIDAASAITYLSIAEDLQQKDTPQKTIVDLYKKAISKVKIKQEYTKKIPFYSNTEWMLKSKSELVRIHESYAFYLLDNDKKDEALEHYLKAFSLAFSDLNYKAAENMIMLIKEQFSNKTENMLTLENILSEKVELKIDDYPLEISEKFIIKNNYTDTVLTYNKELFQKNNPSGDYDKYLDELISIGEEYRRKELNENKIDGPSAFGVFRKTDGSYVDPMEWQEKAVAIVFWSTWCGPCQIMIPAIEELESMYADSNDVEVFAVNVWENPDSRFEDLDKFLDENNVKYEILIDESDQFPQKFGVLGLPAVIYLDKKGRLQFLEEGFTNYDDFIQNSVDRLEVLRK